MDTRARVKQFILDEIVAESDLGISEISDGEDLAEAGILDSLGMLKLIAFLDEELHTDIMSQTFTLDDFATLDKICARIGQDSVKEEASKPDPVPEETALANAATAPASVSTSESTAPAMASLSGTVFDTGLKDKVVLITGASRGLGAEMARLFALQGSKVVVNYRSNGEAARSVASQIESDGGQACIVRADISDNGQVIGMFQQVRESWGDVDVLVNNAIKDYANADFQTIEWPDVQDALNVIVRGAFNCCKAAIPGMLEKGSGNIINIGTLATDNPAVNQLKYVLSKSALVGMTRSLAVDYAGKNIRVNLICPSLVATDLVSHIPKKFIERLGKDTPLQRNATVTDVAQAAIYLASNQASFVTGQKIMVTGGLAPFH